MARERETGELERGERRRGAGLVADGGEAQLRCAQEGGGDARDGRLGRARARARGLLAARLWMGAGAAPPLSPPPSPRVPRRHEDELELERWSSVLHGKDIRRRRDGQFL